MSSGLESYLPNPALAWIYQRFFQHIEVDEAWAGRVREADGRGTVVYVLRNLSFVDFLALDYLTKTLRLPQVRFANDLGLWVLEPMGRGWLSALRPRREVDDVQRLRKAIDGGHSAALFLKRPPTLLDPAPVARQRGGVARALPTRGKAEGDAFLRAVLEAQQRACAGRRLCRHRAAQFFARHLAQAALARLAAKPAGRAGKAARTAAAPGRASTANRAPGQ